MRRPTEPSMYIINPTTRTHHLRASFGVVEEDGYSLTYARCGWEYPGIGDAPQPTTYDADARFCGRCVNIAP